MSKAQAPGASLRMRMHHLARYVRHHRLRSALAVLAALVVAAALAAAAAWGVGMLRGDGRNDAGYGLSSAESHDTVRAVKPLNVGSPPGTAKGYHALDAKEAERSVRTTSCVVADGTVKVSGTTANHTDGDQAYHHYVTLKTDKDWYRVQVNVKRVKAGASEPFSLSLPDSGASGRVSSCAVASEARRL